MHQLRKEKEEITKILYENDVLLVISKPPGWITNDAETAKGQPTVQSWLATNFKFPIFEFRELRNGIVHRLDKETSGCLIIAKTQDAFFTLQAQFKERVIDKKYIALVHGRLKEPEGEIKAAVGRLPWRRDRFGVLSGGREAQTSYKLLSNHTKDGEELSLVTLHPLTGRTHQIRIHMKHINHPLVADTFYAGRKRARKDRLWCPRLFLHASEISFINPLDNKKVTVTAPLPDDLQAALGFTR